tara:strand:- start:232 stop:858 length:627 start_codon:yes stop_codon:yes gene_type:complete
MPLYRSFKLDKNKSFYIWEIKESLMDLEKEVTLSLNDKEKLLSIKLAQRKKEFLASRALLNFTKLQNTEIKYNKDGAPELDNGKYISITHCENFAGIAIGNNKIGFDLEIYREKIFAIAPKFLNETEKFIYEFNSVIKGLTLIWTAKEAIYKAVSAKGISFKNNIIISPFKNEQKKGFAKVYLNQKEMQISFNFIIGKNFCGSVAYIN